MVLTLEVTNLNDTDISSETLNDLLVYDGTNYVNKGKHEIMPNVPFKKQTAQGTVF